MNSILYIIRARALWGLTRNLRKPRNTAKCLPTPSLHFCYPGGTGSAAFPAQTLMMHGAPALVLAQHLRSEFALQSQPSVRQAALEQLPTPMPFTPGSFIAR